MLPVLTSLVWSLHFVSGSDAQWTVGQEVTTASGIAKGHAARSYPQVSEYLGIRYGQTTEGANRFLPPKPYTSTAKIGASDYVSRALALCRNELIGRRERKHIFNCHNMVFFFNVLI
jgi:hypothetical protein